MSDPAVLGRLWCFFRRRWWGLPLLVLLTGCSSGPSWTFHRDDIAPLQYAEQIFTYDDVQQRIPPSALLSMDEDMRDFVRQHASPGSPRRTRLLSLHGAIKSPGLLDIQYDPFADGGAQAVFHRGSANCLSYAHLFVAMAREAGLDARYQQVDIRPEWQRIGDRVAVRLHVNVLVTLSNGEEYTVDIDPLSRKEIAGTRVLTDEQAWALHHSNLAMHHLSDDRPGDAWMALVRGLELGPDMSHLWVNLGAIYRMSGQYEEAERAYLRALAVNGGDRSAMNNLVVLYETTGRDEERRYWWDRLERYRVRNPYFHASLGDRAMAADDLDRAFEHYSRAHELQPDDGQLIYSLGLLEHRRGNDEAAERLIEQAIEKALYSAEARSYRVTLQALERERAASL